MGALVIKDFPEGLHRMLKMQAKDNHRSMAREALTILENGLVSPPKVKLPPLVRGKFLLTDEWIDRAKREGRE
ncbi:MAG: Arc family DNA-binding protein [bacterium]|nr:Arc family DNA-binding protein [bacterium]